MTILTKKFSEFAAGTLDGTNKTVGLSNGANAQFDGVITWTTLTRPTTPTTGLLGYNSTLAKYEYYDVGAMAWVQLDTSAAGSGTVNPGLINELGWYASGGSTISGLTTVNSRILVTSPAGVPTWASTLPPFTMSGNIDMGGFRAINAAEPSADSDYATKFYVDQTALNGTSVYAATTATLNATQSGAGVGATLTDASGTFAAFTVDGVSPTVGDNILNKDQTNAANQGIYTLTTNGDGVSIPWVLTRATSYNTPVEINNTGLIAIRNGSTLAGSVWYNAATIVTVDTTNFSYSQFGALFLTKTLANGKIFRGNASNIATASTASYPDAAGAIGNVITSDGTNFVSSPNTGGANQSTVLFLMGG